MAASWHDLLANFSVVAAFVAAWIYLQAPLTRLRPTLQSLALGLLMGTGAVAAMIFSAGVGPGMIADLRIPLLALAGLFGGPMAGALAALMAVSYRLYLGGAGATLGVLGIAIAATIGIACNLVARRIRVGRTEIFAFSTLVGFGSLLGLVFLPDRMRSDAIAEFALPSALLSMLSTLILGLAMHLDLKRRELVAANKILEAAFFGLPDGLDVKDPDGRFILANPATAKLMGAESGAALIGRTAADFYPAEIAARFRSEEQQVMGDGQPSATEQPVKHTDGQTTWLSTLKAPLRDERGRVVGVVTHNRDVTAQRRMQEDLVETRQILADALDYMADALVMFDKDERLMFCNRQYLELFPGTADIRVPNVAFADILRTAIARGEESIGDADIETWISERCAMLHTGGERRFQLADGRWIEARSRPVKADGRSLSVFSDITVRKRAEEALDQLNKRLAALASTDGLTSLMNRRSFDQALEREFARCLRDGSPLAMLIIDVDRFKSFNDTYGHLAGDDCLKAISRCIENTFKRPADVVARFGGEEFAVLLPGTTPAGAYHLALRLRMSIRELAIPHIGNEHGLVTASIGVAAAAANGLSGKPEDMIHRADEALYLAKAAGRDRVRAAEEQRLPDQPPQQQQLRG